VALVVSSSTALTLLTNMNEKHNSTTPSPLQVKNQQKTIGIEEKLDVITQSARGEQIAELCLMLGSLIVVYIQFVIMLVELQKMLTQELKCLLQGYPSPIRMNHTINYRCESIMYVLH
jgi:hypothetical protein